MLDLVNGGYAILQQGQTNSDIGCETQTFNVVHNTSPFIADSLSIAAATSSFCARFALILHNGISMKGTCNIGHTIGHTRIAPREALASHMQKKGQKIPGPISNFSFQINTLIISIGKQHHILLSNKCMRGTLCVHR